MTDELVPLTFPNNVNTLLQAHVNGQYMSLQYRDADNNVVEGNALPSLAIQEQFYRLSPTNFFGKEWHFKAHQLLAVAATDLAAQGLKSTLIGNGSISIATGSSKNSLQLSSGSTLGSGAVIENTAFKCQFADFAMALFQITIPTGLSFDCYLGLWDGSISSNSIYLERAEGSLPNQNFAGYSCASGTRNSGVATGKGADTNRWTFGFVRDGANVSFYCYDPNNYGACSKIGEVTTNIPKGVNLWPFIKFTSLSAGVVRNIHIDKIYAFAVS